MSVKREWNLLRMAVMCYTRLPMRGVTFTPEAAREAARYMPLVGALVGGCGALVYWLLHDLLLIPQAVAVIPMMATTILVTGAFHEDGFSDFLDGFGGGTTKERVLEIMKDSRTGVFGVLGTVLQLLLKYACLASLAHPMLLIVVICCSGRAVPLLLMTFSSYARRENSKLSRDAYLTSRTSVVIGVVTGLLALATLGWIAALATLVVYALLLLFVYYESKRRIGGYTGDVLGALEQMCEMGCLIAVLAVQQLTLLA
jgi:adenosylcobinamide-GDP ribazoletransferase